MLTRQMARLTQILLVPVLAAAVAACGAPSAAPPTAVKAETVRFHVPSNGIDAVPYYLADVLGYYKEEGITIERMEMPAATGIKAMVGGDFEFSAAGASGIAAAATGVPVKAIFAGEDKPPFFAFAKGNIKTIADLKGKTFGVSSAGSAPEIMARIVLEKNGLKPEQDVTMIALGVQRYPPLKAGSVDAAMISSPDHLMARKDGFNELPMYQDPEVQVFTGGIMTTKKMISERPDLVKRMARASLKGLRVFLEKRDQIISHMATYQQVTPEQAGAIYDSLVFTFTKTGYTSEEQSQRDIKFALYGKDQSKAPAVSDVFDYSFVKEAEKDLAASGWKP